LLRKLNGHHYRASISTPRYFFISILINLTGLCGKLSAAGNNSGIADSMAAAASANAPLSNHHQVGMSSPKVFADDGSLVPLEHVGVRPGELNGIPILDHLDHLGDETGVIEQVDFTPILPTKDNVKGFVISVQTDQFALPLAS
jgi:hypothetical protein